MSDTRSAPAPGARYPCFDGLRAVAAGTIVVFHAASIAGSTTATWFGRFFARLDVGVAVFFVISGFLLYRPFVAAHLQDRPARRWREFWWRRVLRIYPAYWVALTAAILLFRSTDLHGAGDYLRHYALVQIYTPKYGLAGIVPTWSLAVEISFYAALPLYAGLLARVGARLAPRGMLALEITAVVLLYAAGLAVRAGLFVKNGPGTVSAQWLPAQLDLFALGIVLAVLATALDAGLTNRIGDPVSRVLRALGERAALSWALAAVGFVVVCDIGLPTNFAVGSRPQEMVRQVLYGLIAFFLVVPAVFGPQDRGAMRRALRSRPAVAVGMVSYGVFLWHFDWMNQLIDDGLFRHVHEFRFLVLVALGSVLTLITAALSWFVVERPALALKQRPAWFARGRAAGSRDQ